MQTNALMPITQATVIVLFFRPPLHSEQLTASKDLFLLLLVSFVKRMLIAPNETVLLFLLLLFVTWLNIFLNVQLFIFFPLLGFIQFLVFLRLLDLHFVILVLIPCLHSGSFLADSIVLQRSVGCIFISVAFFLFASLGKP